MPFVLGVEPYNTSETQKNKTAIQAVVMNKVWPVVILEVEGTYSVEATM